MVHGSSDRRELSKAFKSVAICYTTLLGQYFEELNLTASQGEVLLYLYQAVPDTVQTCELLRVFPIAPASLSATLKKLKEKGYIFYAREQPDNRRKAISLTQKALYVQPQLEEKMRTFENLIYQQIEDSDCTTACQILEVILQNIAGSRAEKPVYK